MSSVYETQRKFSSITLTLEFFHFLCTCHVGDSSRIVESNTEVTLDSSLSKGGGAFEDLEEETNPARRRIKGVGTRTCRRRIQKYDHHAVHAFLMMKRNGEDRALRQKTGS